MAVEKSSSGTSTPSTTSTMDRFQKIVLSWDYLRLIAESKVHAHQPHHTCHSPDIPSKSLTFSGHGGQGGKQAKVLQHVKNTYVSVAEYLGVFEPLLFEEVKAQIIQGRSNDEEG